MRIISAVFAALLFLGSCTSASRKTGEYDAAQTKVRVDNRNVMSVTVYVLTPSDQLDLGLVQGLSTGVFTIPNGMVVGSTSLQLLADPVGSSQDGVSETFSVSPGDVIDMVVEPLTAP